MIVRNLDFMRIFAIPFETDALLIVDADAPLPRALALCYATLPRNGIASAPALSLSK